MKFALYNLCWLWPFCVFFGLMIFGGIRLFQSEREGVQNRRLRRSFYSGFGVFLVSMYGLSIQCFEENTESRKAACAIMRRFGY